MRMVATNHKNEGIGELLHVREMSTPAEAAGGKERPDDGPKDPPAAPATKNPPPAAKSPTAAAKDPKAAAAAKQSPATKKAPSKKSAVKKSPLPFAQRNGPPPGVYLPGAMMHPPPFPPPHPMYPPPPPPPMLYPHQLALGIRAPSAKSPKGSAKKSTPMKKAQTKSPTKPSPVPPFVRPPYPYLPPPAGPGYRPPPPRAMFYPPLQRGPAPPGPPGMMMPPPPPAAPFAPIAPKGTRSPDRKRKLSELVLEDTPELAKRKPGSKRFYPFKYKIILLRKYFAQRFFFPSHEAFIQKHNLDTGDAISKESFAGWTLKEDLVQAALDPKADLSEPVKEPNTTNKPVASRVVYTYKEKVQLLRKWLKKKRDFPTTRAFLENHLLETGGEINQATFYNWTKDKEMLALAQETTAEIREKKRMAKSEATKAAEFMKTSAKKDVSEMTFQDKVALVRKWLKVGQKYKNNMNVFLVKEEEGAVRKPTMLGWIKNEQILTAAKSDVPIENVVLDTEPQTRMKYSFKFKVEMVRKYITGDYGHASNFIRAENGGSTENRVLSSAFRRWLLEEDIVNAAKTDDIIIEDERRPLSHTPYQDIEEALLPYVEEYNKTEPLGEMEARKRAVEIADEILPQGHSFKGSKSWFYAFCRRNHIWDISQHGAPHKSGKELNSALATLHYYAKQKNNREMRLLLNDVRKELAITILPSGVERVIKKDAPEEKSEEKTVPDATEKETAGAKTDDASGPKEDDKPSANVDRSQVTIV